MVNTETIVEASILATLIATTAAAYIGKQFESKVESSATETVKILLAQPFTTSKDSRISVCYMIDDGEAQIQEVATVTIQPGEAEATLKIVETHSGDINCYLTNIHVPHLPYEATKEEQRLINTRS